MRTKECRHPLSQESTALGGLFDECNVIADAEAILELERAAETANLALRHDGNAVAK